MDAQQRQLRKFGLVVGGVFAAIGALLLWRSHLASLTGSVLVVLGTALVLLGAGAPRLLAPAERFWMRIAHLLGWINTRLLLGILFFTVITVTRIGLLLFRKDPLHRRPDPARSTYWVDLPGGAFEPASYEDPF